jgi:glycosyltransferase involved in cell wall biosynthesis
MKIFRSSIYHLLDEILGKIARIESTVNFLYDNFEFFGQNINIFEMQRDLILARKTSEFGKVYKKKSPKISVIMPISRPAHIVEKSISSVLSQTHSNLEVILITEKYRNDISKLIHKIDDSRLKLLVNESESKVTGNWSRWASSGAESRTHGLRHAKCDFFTFLDDDDLMEPNKIEKCLKFAQEHKHEIVGHLDGAYNGGNLSPLRTNKTGKTRTYLGGSVDYLGLGTNVLLIHNFYLRVDWPKFNYKNLKGNDTVYLRMLFALNPKYGFLPEILTIKN